MNAEIDMTGVVLKTERLTLRPWTEDDLEDFYAYAKEDGVGQMAGWAPHKNIEESKEILKHFIEGRNQFAIEYEGRAVGSIGIEKYNEEKLPQLDSLKGRELGFVLAKECWGKGLMTEGVKEVIRYCFEDLHYDFLVCGYFKKNHRSARVQEKCGFRYVRDHEYHTRFNTVEDAVLNVLYRSEWETLK